MAPRVNTCDVDLKGKALVAPIVAPENQKTHGSEVLRLGRAAPLLASRLHARANSCLQARAPALMSSRPASVKARDSHFCEAHE